MFACVRTPWHRTAQTAFTAARGALGDHYADLVLRAREEQASQCAVLQREVDELKELLQTYATSSHTKDQVIANLKQALDHERAAAAQKEAELAEKRAALDAQREHASNLIATRHYQSTQLQKCFRALHAQVEKKWKRRLEKACKVRAKEVCSQLAEEYEVGGPHCRNIAAVLPCCTVDVAGQPGAHQLQPLRARHACPGDPPLPPDASYAVMFQPWLVSTR